MLPTLKKLDFISIYAADYSSEMLLVCKSNSSFTSIKFSEEDIYNTSFNDQRFMVLLSSRFIFHCDDQERLFTEFNRLIKADGYLIFDTLRWSPRTWTSLFSSRLGGNIYTNSDISILTLANNHGFTIVDSESILILPSFIYKFLPKLLITLLDKLESIWPSNLKTKKIWILKKK
ncbi:hypothetical protein BCU68_01200 [Vibrio sp. 10N.286.49.B3]|nr:hypothetical protein BCU68_01200 [Vibrio sp. 10N.286.49.B3]